MGLGPFDLTGGPFLILYLALFAGAVIAGIVLPVRMRPPGRPQQVTNADDLAVLAGGKARYVEALVARLLARKALTLDGRRGLIPVPGARGDATAEMRVLGLSGPIKLLTIQRQIADHADPVIRRLKASGLYMTGEQVLLARWWQTLPYVLLAAFGTIKLMIGEARGKPVGILTALLIVTVIAALVRWFVIDRRTQAAHDALAEAARRHERLKRAPLADEVGLAVALFGTGVLAGSAFDDFHRMRSGGDGGSSSGGGDSSGSSSDGGGSSGCGGGGCGGCGGS